MRTRRWDSRWWTAAFIFARRFEPPNEMSEFGYEPEGRDTKGRAAILGTA